MVSQQYMSNEPGANSGEVLSVIVPFFNEEEGIEVVVPAVIEAIRSWEGEWEIIAVNDGSTDSSVAKLLAWHCKDPRVKVVDLTRNFGHQKALLAGLQHSSGAFVAIVDGDLQDPPELLLPMISVLRKQKADVVYGVRRKRKESLAKVTAYWLAYRLLRATLDIDLPLDAGDFCVMKRCVVNAVLQMPEQSLFLRGIRSWVGFRQIPFEYDRNARCAGVAKYQWRDLLRLATNGLFSFTALPIRCLGFLGGAAVTVSVVYSLYLIAAWATGAEMPRGFTTLILAIIFFSGVQLIALRLIGAYVHRIYDEVRGRPKYLVRTFWGQSSEKRQVVSEHPFGNPTGSSGPDDHVS